MLADMDIGYFNKVKSSKQETCKRADFSNTSNKNPSQECKFWVVNGNSAPQTTYASKALPGHHWMLVQDSTGATLMGVKPLPHWELYKCNLTPMPHIPPMLLVSEPHPNKAEQLLRAVLGDIGVHFCEPAQTIIVPHPFSLSTVFSQMTALLKDSEQMAPMCEVYLALLAQMFVTQMVSIEQYLLLRAHIHGFKLLTQSEAAAAIFSQSTGGNVSDEEAMSCDDKTPVMPPAVPRLSSSRQILWGVALHQLLTQQPSPTPLPLPTL